MTHRASTLVVSGLLLASCMLAPSPLVAAVRAAAPADDQLAPVQSSAELPIKAVTVYRGRAAVTRSGAQQLAQGVHELRVGPLPAYADLESVQAKIGGGAKLLDLKTETIALPAPASDNPRVREALAAVESARAALADADRRVANNAAALKVIESIAAKVASDASQALGAALDPEKLRTQLAFIEGERDRLSEASLMLAASRTKAAGKLTACEKALAAAGGAPPAERFALVTISVPQGGSVPVDVTYLVGNATWKPAYTVRGDAAAGTLAIEYDAVVRQATGEDWSDVSLALSTAEPTRAANPRELSPSYLVLFDPKAPAAVADPAPMAPRAPAPAIRSATGGPGGGGFGSAGEMNDAETGRSEKLAKLADDATVGGSGAAVEYRLPRTFSARSDASAERRTRVASIDAKPKFTLVARPLADSDVYLRARFVNESGFILLPGSARVYLGSDSIGTAPIAEIAAGGQLDLWFGKEPRVTVKRELVSKKASESGLFSKAKGIDREYRVSLVNTLPRAVEVEVWDRVPVSRDEQAKIELTGISPALSTDAKYLKDERPQGFLKWVLPLPARADGSEAAPVAISWKTRTIWPDGLTLGGDVD